MCVYLRVCVYAYVGCVLERDLRNGTLNIHYQFVIHSVWYMHSTSIVTLGLARTVYTYTYTVYGI